MRVCQRI